MGCRSDFDNLELYCISFIVLLFLLQSRIICLITGLCLIACIVGRFGVNCTDKCHCKNALEDCQAKDGYCQSGCAQNITGDTCQGNA